MADTREDISRLEALAEEAYEAMYDARPPQAKAYYEDAMLHLGLALAVAERTDDLAAFERLTLRRDHIRNVYEHQFRGVG